MSSDDLFAAEEQVIAAAQQLLDHGRFADRVDGKLYEELLKDYQKLFRTTRRLMKLSDRNEQQLNAMGQEQRRANEIITQKNKELDALSTKLSKYLSPQIYHSIFTGAQNVEIASSRKKLTIFFSDVVNFTETTDKLESEDLTNLLNRYLTEMSNIALRARRHHRQIYRRRHHGLLRRSGNERREGRRAGLRPHGARHAAAHARAQAEWQERGAEKPFQLRVGINTGYCTVGNFGSEDRMDYTIIGSAVNLTARLQSRAEIDGILIGHETYSLVKDEVAA